MGRAPTLVLRSGSQLFCDLDVTLADRLSLGHPDYPYALDPRVLAHDMVRTDESAVGVFANGVLIGKQPMPKRLYREIRASRIFPAYAEVVLVAADTTQGIFGSIFLVLPASAPSVSWAQSIPAAEMFDGLAYPDRTLQRFLVGRVHMTQELRGAQSLFEADASSLFWTLLTGGPLRLSHAHAVAQLLSSL